MTVAHVLKGSPRSLRVMAPPPLLHAYHTLGVFRHHLSMWDLDIYRWYMYLDVKIEMKTHFIFQSLSCKIALMTVIHATAATIKLVFFSIGFCMLISRSMYNNRISYQV